MRRLIGSVLSIVLALCAGCGETRTAQTEPAVPSGGVSMYPLTAPSPAPPMQGYAGQAAPAADPYATAAVYAPPPSPYGQLAATTSYTGGQYCEVVDMSEASMTVPMIDPPIMVDNTLYASTSPAPVMPPSLPPPYTATAPAPTYTPTVAGMPSPYAGLTTTTTYSAPTYTTTTYTASSPAYSTTATYTAATPAYSDAEIYTMPNFGTVSPAYTSSSGQYCEVTDTSESSYMIPMVDPPIQVDGRTTSYYAPQAAPAPLQASTPAYAPLYAPAPVTTAPALYTPPPTVATTTAAFTPGPPMTGELQLVPALDIPPGNHPSDYGPSQWFEIVRPGNGPIRIGRVSSTCVCVGVRVPNRFVAAGQRALVEARLMSRPPQNNITYGLYVQVLEPTNTMLDVDVTVSARR